MTVAYSSTSLEALNSNNIYYWMSGMVEIERNKHMKMKFTTPSLGMEEAVQNPVMGAKN